MSDKTKQIQALNDKYHFSDEELKDLSHGMECYLSLGLIIPISAVDALYKWDRYFAELKTIMTAIQINPYEPRK